MWYRLSWIVVFKGDTDSCFKLVVGVHSVFRGFLDLATKPIVACSRTNRGVLKFEQCFYRGGDPKYFRVFCLSPEAPFFVVKVL